MRNRILQRLENKKRRRFAQLGGTVNTNEAREWKSYYPEKDDNKDEDSNKCYIDENGKKICLAQDFKSEEEARKYVKRFPPTSQEELDKVVIPQVMKQTGGMYDQMRQYQMGGQQLPGGMVEPIPGSDAVQFSGATHDQGGIMMDNVTEVEDGETMDQVTMAKKGGKRDYFFSSHLKRGGVSFADQHKDILANGGTQEDIDYLARMQEKVAGRKSGKVKAKLGGVVQYSNGGTFKASSDKSNQILEILKANGYDVPDVEDLGGENISENQAYLGSGYYGEKDIKSDENRKDFYNRNKATLDKIDIDGDGVPDITSWEDFDPKKHTAAFQEGFNTDMMDVFNNDQNLVQAFKDANLSGDDLKEFGFYESGTAADTGKDKLFGEYTWSRRNPLLSKKEEEEDPCPACPDGTVPVRDEQGNCPCPEGDPDIDPDPCPACPDGTVPTKQPDGTCPCDGTKEKKKDYSSTLLGLGSMIPAVMAFTEKPDYMESPDLIAPGIVKAERVAKQHLDRVDFNDQIARNASDAGAMNKFIETSGGGPANMANKMALYAKKQQGDREIKGQEARANIAIANEEANLDNKRKVFNSEAALDASKFNVGSQERAAVENTSNKMYIDEFNRGADAATKDRKLNAVQYGVNTLASLHRDKLAYKAQSEYADAIDGQRDALERFNEITGAKRGGYRKLNLMRKRYGK